MAKWCSSLSWAVPVFGHGNEYPKSASGKKRVCLVCGAESNSGSAWGVYGYVGARGTKPNLRGSTMQSLCCGGSLADLNACILVYHASGRSYLEWGRGSNAFNQQAAA